MLEQDDPRLVQARNEVEVRNAVATAGRTAAHLARRFVSWLASTEAAGAIAERFGGYVEQALRSAKGDRLKFLEQLAESLPDRVEPLEALAREHLEHDNWAAANGKLDEALRLAPESATLLGLKAEVLDKQGDASEALRFYRRAVRVAPNDNKAFSAFVAALTKVGRKDDALRELDARLDLTPDYGPAWAEKGRLLLQARRFAESAEALQRAERLLPAGHSDLLAVRISLGEALRGANQYAEARDAFGRAVEADSELGDGHARKSILLVDIAEYREAAELLQSAIDRLPAVHENREARFGWLLNTRGWALYCDGGMPFAELEKLFREAGRHVPVAPFATKNLGQVFLRMPGRKEEGWGILERLAEVNVSQAPLDLVGWCHFRLGRYEAAEQWLRASLREDPDNAAATNFDLALVLLAKDATDARENYAEAKARAERHDVLRQRGLFHIAAQDAKEAVEDGVVEAVKGRERLKDLTTRLEELGFERQRLAKLALTETD